MTNSPNLSPEKMQESILHFIDNHCVKRQEIEQLFKKGNTKEITSILCEIFNRLYNHNLSVKVFNELVIEQGYKHKRSTPGRTFTWLMSKESFNMYLDTKPTKLTKLTKPKQENSIHIKKEETPYPGISKRLCLNMSEHETISVSVNDKGRIEFDKKQSLDQHYNYLLQHNNDNLFDKLNSVIESSLETEERLPDTTGEYLIISNEYNILLGLQEEEVKLYPDCKYVVPMTIDIENRMTLISSICSRIRYNIARCKHRKKYVLSDRYGNDLSK